MDCPFDAYKERVYQRIFNHMAADKIHIPVDVANVIDRYYILRNEQWLDMVVNDAIAFIKRKFKEIKPKAEVRVFNALNLRAIKLFMDTIHWKTK